MEKLYLMFSRLFKTRKKVVSQQSLKTLSMRTSHYSEELSNKMHTNSCWGYFRSQRKKIERHSMITSKEKLKQRTCARTVITRHKLKHQLPLSPYLWQTLIRKKSKLTILQEIFGYRLSYLKFLKNARSRSGMISSEKIQGQNTLSSATWKTLTLKRAMTSATSWGKNI